MDDVEKISRANLSKFKKSGVVETVKVYTAEDGEVCESCRTRHGAILKISKAKIGRTIPPFDFCEKPVQFDYQHKNGCRCYWRAEHISIE